MKRLLALVLMISVVLGVTALYANAQTEETALPWTEKELSHHHRLEALRQQRRQEGWAETDYVLCRHGGATDYNDLTLQREENGVLVTRHFCPYLLCDFEPAE